MPSEIQARMFIRSLADTLESDRLIRKAALAFQHKERANHFRQLCKNDLNDAIRLIGPLDRVRLQMKTEPQGQRTG